MNFKCFFTIIVLLFISLTGKTQNNWVELDTLHPPSNLENVSVKPLYKDSLHVSSYLIFIKKEVKAHKHLEHAEHVYVLQGEGNMTLGDKEFKIKKGSFIFIPKNTFHSVLTTSKTPLKVVSIQAPFFDGKDRVFKE
jgi:mannose-6-phosphate isomerase-like protein (cupin superfamily)